MDEHTIALEELYQRVESSGKGLTSSEAQKRLEQCGYNVLKISKETPIVVKYLKQFINFFAMLLIFGSVLAFTAEASMRGEYTEVTPLAQYNYLIREVAPFFDYKRIRDNLLEQIQERGIESVVKDNKFIKDIESGEYLDQLWQEAVRS